ncbi:MAG TPA: hypothetical protein VD816_03300, partial [Ohtaekwangia sp.]|nr:hypothetical protein [Ohtaekwangia sp.]
MKKVILGCLAAMFVTACQDNDTGKKEFTGNEATYALSPGSAYPIDGTVTFREKTDGSTLVVLQLNGTEGNLQHPAHLHAGDISTPDADIAALLNPVTGSTGRSETLLREL